MNQNIFHNQSFVHIKLLITNFHFNQQSSYLRDLSTISAFNIQSKFALKFKIFIYFKCDSSSAFQFLGNEASARRCDWVTCVLKVGTSCLQSIWCQRKMQLVCILMKSMYLFTVHVQNRTMKRELIQIDLHWLQRLCST